MCHTNGLKKGQSFSLFDKSYITKCKLYLYGCIWCMVPSSFTGRNVFAKYLARRYRSPICPNVLQANLPCPLARLTSQNGCVQSFFPAGSAALQGLGTVGALFNMLRRGERRRRAAGAAWRRGASRVLSMPLQRRRQPHIISAGAGCRNEVSRKNEACSAPNND